MKISNTLIHRIVKVLFSLLVLLGATQYFFNYGVVSDMFTSIHFPLWLIYPMGTAKFLGLVAIWTNLSAKLKEWAYAGYTFNFLLAIGAHVAVADGEFFPATMALIFLVATYISGRKVELAAGA